MGDVFYEDLRRTEPLCLRISTTTITSACMTVTEYDAQRQAALDLRVLLQTLDIFGKRELQTMKLDQLWIYFIGFLKEQSLSDTIDQRTMLRVIRAGVVRRLIRLLVDFQSLNQCCSETSFEVRVLLRMGSRRC